ALTQWLATRHAAGWAVVTLDGKTLRGSADGDVPGVHLLAAYAPQAAAVLGQLQVDAKTNEHKAALRLLGILPPLKGAVVTADAHEYDGAERLPELAGGGPGVPAGASADRRRHDDDRGGLRHHQPDAGAGRGGPVAGVDARPLGHRESAALRARRDIRGGSLP